MGGGLSNWVAWCSNDFVRQRDYLHFKDKKTEAQRTFLVTESKGLSLWNPLFLLSYSTLVQRFLALCKIYSLSVHTKSKVTVILFRAPHPEKWLMHLYTMWAILVRDWSPEKESFPLLGHGWERLYGIRVTTTKNCKKSSSLRRWRKTFFLSSTMLLVERNFFV